MYSVLICDDSVTCFERLDLAIKKEPQFKVVAHARDGKIALALIERHRPDIIILDVVMPEYDGVYVVNYVRKSMKEYAPIIYVLSGFGTDSIIKTMRDLCVNYFSMKPFSMSAVMQNLNILIKQQSSHVISGKPAEDNGNNTEAINQEILIDTVKVILLQFGLMPHRTSTKCVADALIFYICSSEANPMLTKVLYPRIAKKYEMNDSSVEKNIRNAISQVQMKETELFNEIFSYSRRDRITNGEFLSVMAEYIIRKLKK